MIGHGRVKEFPTRFEAGEATGNVGMVETGEQ